MNKKHQSVRKFMLNAIALSLFATPVFADDAENTNLVQIESKPLLGVTDVSPAVVLALSVEFPTAGIAYSQSQSLGLQDLHKDKPYYRGYFDATKCYEYVQTVAPGAGGYVSKGVSNTGKVGTEEKKWGDGYFQVTGNATSLNDYHGLCSGEHEWSGNALNFLTMSALDIFRQTLTGGNRARGVGGSNIVYQAGDKKGETYLRRATMWDGSEVPLKTTTGGGEIVGQQYRMDRYRSFNSEMYKPGNGFSRAPLDYLVPHAFLQTMKDLTGNNEHATSDNNWKNNGNPAPTNYDGTLCSKRDNINALIFVNSGTGFFPMIHRKDVYNGGRPFDNGVFKADQMASNNSQDCAGNGTANDGSSVGWFNVVVKQEGEKKPVGLLQQYARERGMRVAVMSYLTGSTTGEEKPHANLMDGGVLRAKMKNVSGFKYFKAGDDGSANLVKEDVKEWDEDGVLLVNPDNFQRTDANGNDVGNSGVINYINKFGDATSYDVKDAVNELYYTALRYLRHDGVPFGDHGVKDMVMTEDIDDNFPAYSEWEDPLNPNSNLMESICFAPTIITIGDANNHMDNAIPNMPNSMKRRTFDSDTKDATQGDHTVDDDSYVAKLSNVSYKSKTYNNAYELVHAIQGSVFPINAKASANDVNSPNSDLYSPIFAMAGMSYWAHTNNIRPDATKYIKSKKGIEHNFYVQNFFIDVFEGGNPHNWNGGPLNNASINAGANKVANPFYLAGKFGGFLFDEKKNAIEQVLNRSNWTDDAENESSLSYYTDGMPRNFAIANNPDNMVSALQRAFQSVGFPENSMQSGIQYNNPEGEKLGIAESALFGGDSAILERKNDGTVSIKNKEQVKTDATTGKVPLALRAGYRTSDWTGYLTANIVYEAYQDVKVKDSETGEEKIEQRLTPKEVELWNAGTELNTDYHSATTYTKRKIRTKTGAGFIDFNAQNAGDLKTAIEHEVYDAIVVNEMQSDLSTKQVRLSENFFNQLNQGRSETQKVTATDLINYLLGDNSNEGKNKNLRERQGSLMGTSVYSSVTPILRNSKTSPVKGVPIGQEDNFCYYGEATLRQQDYVATNSNDGVFHIFDMKGKEKFAYLPQTALPYLANYASPSYQHRFVNDGAIMLHEVCEGDKAKTYLIGSSGRGASSVYVVDATTENFKEILEINSTNDDGIGVLVSSPIVVNDGAGDVVLIFSSGYNNKKDEGYLFFYKLDGTQVGKVRLGRSGVGAPIAYDANDDGIADLVYVGDHDGKLYRVSANGEGRNTRWNVDKADVLFEGDGKPITSRPFVTQVSGKTVVLVGTGEYFSMDDIRRTNQQNYAYGFFDDEMEQEDGKKVRPEKLTTADLVEQTIGYYSDDKLVMQNASGAEMNFLTVSQNALQEHHKGWRLVLPDNYTITSDAGVYNGKVAYYTATKTDPTNSTQCEVTGETMVIAVDALTGGAYEEQVFNEPIVNHADKPYLYGTLVFKNFMAQDGVIVKTDKGTVVRLASGERDDQQREGGLNENVGKNSKVTLRRISWREIF